MKAVVMLVLLVGLCGCGSASRSSAPSLWTDGIMLEQKKVTVDERHAKVILQASGDTFNPVDFTVVRGNDPDTRPDHLGTVVKPFRNKVGGWLSRFDSAAFKRFPQLEMLADPGQTLEVRGMSMVAGEQPAPGYGALYNREQVYDASKNKWEERVTPNPTVSTHYLCGPIIQTFMPEKQKVYLAEFVFLEQGDGCELRIFDITRPEQPVPVVTIQGALPSADRASRY